MARTRRSRARQYGGGGGGGIDLGAIVDAFGGDPKLSEGAQEFLKAPGESELPETVYESPSVARRIFFPSSASAAREGNEAWTQSKLAAAFDQAQGGRMSKEELAERTEMEFLDVLAQSRGENMSAENKARKKQLEDKYAKARAGTLGNKTIELGNEGIRLGNEAKALGNREASETSAGRIGAANTASKLGTSRGESELRLLPSDEAARLTENRRRGIDASRVPSMEAPEYQEISPATGELGESRIGPSWLQRVAQKGLEFDEEASVADQRLERQQRFNAEEAEKDRTLRREEGAADRAARNKPDPFMELLAEGETKPGGSVDLGDGTFAVPREGGGEVTAQAAAPETVETTQPDTQQVTVEDFDKLRSEPLPYSQRTGGAWPLVNFFNPMSEQNLVNKLYGSEGLGVTPNAYISPEDLRPENSLTYNALKGMSNFGDRRRAEAEPWFQALDEEQKKRALQILSSENKLINPPSWSSLTNTVQRRLRGE